MNDTGKTESLVFTANCLWKSLESNLSARVAHGCCHTRTALALL